MDVRGVGVAMAIALALGSAPAAAHGQDGPALEHGKLATSDASPVGARALEVEISYTPAWLLRGTGSFERSEPGEAHALGFAATFGLGEDVDVAAAVSWAHAHESAYDRDPEDTVGPASAHGRGFGDTSAGLRWRFLRPSPALELAVLGGLVIPTGAPAEARHVGLTQGFWSAEGAVVASADRFPLTANLELGCSLPFAGDREGERGAGFANLAGGWQVAPWLQPELELNYEHAVHAAGPPSDVLFVTAGVLAPLGERYRLAAGLSCAVWGRHTGQELSATAAFKWAH